MLNIVVIGSGYVGLVSGACFAELGNKVVCVDKAIDKIEALKKGVIPIYEPGLEKIVFKNVKEGLLTFSLSLKEAITKADVVFLAVGTPTDEKDGSADLSYVYAAAKEIAELATTDLVVVTKSTVPVGTGEQLEAIFKKHRPELTFHLCSNPEFLREGSAVEDFMYPDRIAIGTESTHAATLMKQLYRPLTEKGSPLLISNIQTAELLKYAANAFLATKLAFVNEMADLCEQVDADIVAVTRGMGLDKRIGETYLNTGPGYGGSCLPKDTNALAYIAKQASSPSTIVETVIKSNDARKLNMVKKITNAVKGGVANKKVAILGLTFKANTDDMRYSVSLDVVPALLNHKADVHVYDPVGMKEARKWLPADKLTWCNNLDEVLTDADVAVILTEWDEFKTMDIKHLKGLMKHASIVDLRNLFDTKTIRDFDVEYVSIGRA